MRGSRAGWAAMLALALAGCNLLPQRTDTPEIKAAGEQMKAIHSACDERGRSGELKNLTQVEECASGPIIAAYEAAHYPYMDLIRFAEAARVAGAEKVDRGEISAEEYDHQRLELRDRLADEIDRRNAEGATEAEETTLDPATKAKMVQGLSAFSSLEP